MTLPASKRHHHSFPYGLLSHSLECSSITAQNMLSLENVSVSEIEITIISALLHDIGKTQTLNLTEHTSTGRLINHEAFTLSVMANQLKNLTDNWQKGAETLQYLLTWKTNMGFCRFLGGNVMKLADQLSTSASLRRMDFTDKPSYHYFSTLKIGKKQHYINRLG